MLVDRSAIGNAVMRGAFVLALCLSPIAFPSAIEGKVDSCSEGAVSRLYLGQTTPAGAVTELQWRAFVVESVTPRFPAGFTELQAQGHWRDGRGVTIEEGTRIVEIVHDGALLSRERVREVAADFSIATHMRRCVRRSRQSTRAPENFTTF